MHKAIAGSLLFLVLLSSGNRASAQPRDARYHEFGREVLARVQADLVRAERDLHYLSGQEMRHFHNTRERVREFDRKWERGHFDREDLNQAIGSLAHLVDRDRLRPRDREFLAQDLRRLREMRERYERYRDRR